MSPHIPGAGLGRILLVRKRGAYGRAKFRRPDLPHNTLAKTGEHHAHATPTYLSTVAE